MISNDGRIISLPRKSRNGANNKIRELKQSTSEKGYKHVALDGKTYKVHRLVASGFILNTDKKEQINHIDENKSNNHVSNLEWVNSKENINHGTANLRRSITASKSVKAIKDETVLIFNSRKKCAEYIGCSKSKIIIGKKCRGWYFYEV